MPSRPCFLAGSSNLGLLLLTIFRLICMFTIKLKASGLRCIDGWIGIALVALVVGGTAYREYSSAQEQARAQAFGDAVLEVVDLGGTEERAAAIAALPADAKQQAFVQLLLAADPKENREGALKALETLAADATQPQVYRDLAVLRRVMVAGTDMPVADRRAALEQIAIPGRAFRPVAQEALAYILIEEGKSDEAIEALRKLTQDQEAPATLRRRAEQMIAALGGTVQAEGSDQG